MPPGRSTLRREQLLFRQRQARFLDAVLGALRSVDPGAALLDLPAAMTSRHLTRQLWDGLPDESDAISFDSVEAQTVDGERLLPVDGAVPVTLHLGYDVVAVRTNLVAAWRTWPEYAHADAVAFNVCIYPDDLSWYACRAGENLYLMSTEPNTEAGPATA